MLWVLERVVWQFRLYGVANRARRSPSAAGRRISMVVKVGQWRSRPPVAFLKVCSSKDRVCVLQDARMLSIGQPGAERHGSKGTCAEAEAKRGETAQLRSAMYGLTFVWMQSL